MTKKTLNQNGKYVQELINIIEPNFIFSKEVINRFNSTSDNIDKVNGDKTYQLNKLREKITSIENCNLKDNSKKLILGDGDINSPLMLIGEAPGVLEENTGNSFQGEIGSLLKKMLLAINIKKEKVYFTYSINFRPSEDRNQLQEK